MTRFEKAEITALKPLGPNKTELTTRTGTWLFSYSTLVAGWTSQYGLLRTKSFHSRTTSKHINAWLAQHRPSGEVTEVTAEHLHDLFCGKEPNK